MSSANGGESVIPATSPFSTDMKLFLGNEAALGLSASNTVDAGTVTLNSNNTFFFDRNPVSDAFDAVGTIEH